MLPPKTVTGQTATGEIRLAVPRSLSSRFVMIAGDLPRPVAGERRMRGSGKFESFGWIVGKPEAIHMSDKCRDWIVQPDHFGKGLKL